MISQRARRRLLTILVSLVFTLLCIVPAWAVLSQWLVPVTVLHQSLILYPGATFLFDDWLPVSGDTVLHTLFYWTPDTRENVTKYYGTAIPPFVEADDQDNWLITAYTLNSSKPILDTQNGFPVTYGDFCSYAWVSQPRSQCVSVSLVRANHPKLCLLPIVNGDGKSMFLTPYNNCGRIPRTGTLLVFKFVEPG
jgi:hypothetical protein